jgi:phosphoserine phosphatase RsbU/P
VDSCPARPPLCDLQGLAPGRYVFRVKAANSDGFWNERGAVLQLMITPPFWATWWFRTGAALLFVGMAALALHRRVAHVRLVAGLKTAHDAQMAIMPQHDPSLAGFDIAGRCLAVNEVGGDLFDYLRLGGDDGPLCIAVGDVSGKAMGAAMSAVLTSGMLAARVAEATSIAEVMATINAVLHRKAPKHMCAALCLATLDESARTITFVNAGLCPLLLRRGREAAELSSAGPTLPLGPLPGTRFESRTVSLEFGDLVVIHTDGIPEATNPGGNVYGYERVRQHLADLNVAGLGVTEIREAILADAARFASGSHRHDDMALVVVRAV